MFYRLYNVVKDECFNEFASEPVPIREALIFRKTVELIPLQIKETDLIAGWYGYEDDNRQGESSHGSENSFAFYKHLESKDITTRQILSDTFITYGGFSSGHTCIDYGKIAEYGLNYYYTTVEAEFSVENPDTQKSIYLKAMLISLDAVKIYSERFARLALNKAESSDSASDKQRLLRMYNALCRVPYYPAESFYDAIQSVWIMHSLIPIAENSWASISLGRLDQYLYPFYKISIQSGETDENIMAYMRNLFLLLDSYGDGACALNIGGQDADGNDMMNEFSELIIGVEKQLRLRSPILAARISRNTPDRIMNMLIDYKLFSIGQPTFYGEETCRKAVAGRGIPEEKAVGFSVNSCMGLMLAGEEISDMWGWLFNMHLPLELAINKGKPLHGELPFALKTEPFSHIDNVDQLFHQYRCYCSELLNLCLEINRKTALEHAYNYPDPLLSALTEGCIKKGLDRAVGAEYQNITVEAMAMINTGNAIAAIQELVFREKKYSLDDFASAAGCDFYGYDKLLREIRSCEKYGTDSANTDRICRRIADLFSDVCTQFNTGRIRYLPSLHTLDANVDFGRRLYTTLDGRLTGEPVNKNAGPTNDVRKSEPTSMILSAAALNQYRFSGGQPIDIYFDKDLLMKDTGRAKIKTLIKTYFNLGGMQLQVNSIDSETLEKANLNPREYNNLIVRIGGYSVRFRDMSDSSRLELIDRIKREEGKI